MATVLLDLLLTLLWAALAVTSFLYVRRGQFAEEVGGQPANVDYFGEAERYFPDTAGDDDSASLTGNQ